MGTSKAGAGSAERGPSRAAALAGWLLVAWLLCLFGNYGWHTFGPLFAAFKAARQNQAELEVQSVPQGRGPLGKRDLARCTRRAHDSN